MSDIEEDLPEFVEVIKVKNESNLFEMFLPETENEHPGCDSIDSVVDDYSSVKVKKEFEFTDIDKPNREEFKVESSFHNFHYKQEVHDEQLFGILPEIPNKFTTQNQQNIEEFSDNCEADEKIDTSDIIMQSSQHNDIEVKLESEKDSENQKAFTLSKSPKDLPKQSKKKKHCSSIKKKKEKMKNCQFCKKSFRFKPALENHLLKKHRNKIANDLKHFITNKIHTCKICSYATISKRLLDVHISKHIHQKVDTNCKFCNKSYLTKRRLDDHIVKQHKQEIKGDMKSLITTKTHTCNICNSYETTNKDDIDRHINSVHKEIKKKCEFCAESFIYKRSVDEHLLRKHKDKIKNDIKSFITSKIHVCKICNCYETTFKRSIDRHINSVHNNVKIKMKCQFCTGSFMCKQYLNEHVLKKHKDKIKNNINSFITNKIHVCKICNSYETTYKWSLDRHIDEVHNKVKTEIKSEFFTEPISEVINKIKCQFCAKSFLTKQSLDEHVLRKHKDKIRNDIESFITSKMHICTICNTFETTVKRRLDQHINSFHNEDKIKMKCDFCAKSFIFKQSLIEHVVKMHKDKIKNDAVSSITSKIHVCKMCNSYETTNKSKLDRHVNSVHSKVTVKMKCQFCAKSFINKQSLVQHIQTKHTDKINGDIKGLLNSKIYSCKVCLFESTVKNDLEKHVNSIHNK